MLYHDDARGAEAALAPAAHGDPFLRRMRVLDVANPFHRDDMLAVHTDQGRKTGVDRGMVYFLGGGVELGNDLRWD